MAKAPFTPEQVRRIDAYQRSGVFQELTCPTPHAERTLVVRVPGLFCPSCNYMQDWAPDFCDDPRWLRRVGETEE